MKYENYLYYYEKAEIAEIEYSMFNLKKRTLKIAINYFPFCYKLKTISAVSASHEMFIEEYMSIFVVKYFIFLISIEKPVLVKELTWSGVEHHFPLVALGVCTTTAVSLPAALLLASSN